MVPIIIQALRAVVHPRFFESERGFQGQLQANLQANGAAPPNAIVEEEHQKARKIHGIRRRPDIIIHVPTAAGDDRKVGNFAVFALKRRATPAEARADFAALDEMVRVLHYELAVFVNIDNQRTHGTEYGGTFADRVHSFSVWRDGNGTRIRHAHFTGGQLTEDEQLLRPHRRQ